MPRMISKVPHMYDRRNLAVGDEFEADERHVKLLTVIGRAEVKKLDYKRRDMNAQPRSGGKSSKQAQA